MISFFMTFSDPADERRISTNDLAAAAAMIGSVPGLTEGLLFTPLEHPVEHPYKADGAGPTFAVQLRFPDLLACEAALDRGGIIADLAAGAGLPSLAGLDVTHQAMV